MTTCEAQQRRLKAFIGAAVCLTSETAAASAAVRQPSRAFQNEPPETSSTAEMQQRADTMCSLGCPSIGRLIGSPKRCRCCCCRRRQRARRTNAILSLSVSGAMYAGVQWPIRPSRWLRIELPYFHPDWPTSLLACHWPLLNSTQDGDVNDALRIANRPGQDSSSEVNGINLPPEDGRSSRRSCLARCTRLSQ